MEVALAQNLKVMRHVTDHHVSDRAHARRRSIGDALARPRLLRQMAEHQDRSLPHMAELREQFVEGTPFRFSRRYICFNLLVLTGGLTPSFAR